MGDNKQIKDGLGNLFTIRMRDISSASDGSVQRSMILASLIPLDYGTGGMYQHTAKSDEIAAGLAANAPIYAFMWTPASLFTILRRIKLAAWTTATPFGAGLATFELFVARPFSVQDTGGATVGLTGNNAKLRSSMLPSQAKIRRASSGALTPGTRTLDGTPLTSLNVAAPTTALTTFTPAPMTLFDKPPGDHPLVLAAVEGFVIQATVPAAGTWSFAITTEWDEISVY